MSHKNKGFTLIELLVTITIIGVLAAISLFGLAGARESARDGRRRSDLESVRTALELYKADCDRYPASISFGSSLRGSGASSRCPVGNTYMQILPTDPVSGRRYVYNSNGSTYELCSSLEQTTSGTASPCTGGCGSGTCNYRVTSP